MQFKRGGFNQRLGDEARSQRESGNRHRADDRAHGRRPHAVVKPAEIGAFLRAVIISTLPADIISRAL